MEIILKQYVKGLGEKHDVVKVKPGYARNFLIPNGMAVEATLGGKKEVVEILKQRAHKEEKLKKEAEASAEKLKAAKIQVKAKVGDSGKIFGSVNAIQLAEAIVALGFSVERKNINVNSDAIKSTGTYNATVKLHKDVACPITFEVVAE